MSEEKEFYWERVDRNLGIISPEEQQRLRNCTVAIAGCGGMGGQIAVTCARIGVGRIKISDNQEFDASNLNRQYAARVSTLGQSKAASTYQAIKEIVGNDVEVDCDTFGITAENVEQFVTGADYIFDEIEFFQIRPRILLHRAARKAGVPVLNCNVVGFGTRIFLFTPDSMTMEELLGMDEQTVLDSEKILQLLRRLAPRLPQDFSEQIIQQWIIEQNKAPIFGSTPLLSCGTVVTQFVLQFLGVQNRSWIKLIPPMPAYGYVDLGLMEAGIHIGRWW